MGLVLLSGGADSALCLAMHSGYDSLHISYGQTAHAQEKQSAERVAHQLRSRLTVLIVPSVPLQGVEYLGRNLLLVSLGVQQALLYGHKDVIVGCARSDNERFPDCRQDFLQHLNQATLSAYGIGVSAPLIHLSRSQILAELTKHNIKDTWSCYQAGPQPCGECLSCLQ